MDREAIPNRALARRRSREARLALALSASALLLLAAMLLGPVLGIAALSMTDYRLGAPSARFVGLENFAALLADEAMLAALRNTALYVAIVVPTSVLLGLGVALLIHATGRLSGLYASIYFLPTMATLAAMAVAWQMVLHPTIGLLNQLLAGVGIEGRAWLRDEATVLPALAIIGIWQAVGFNVVLFLAGLTTVPRQLYEAAEIDGARSGWSRFRLVTWPMLGPATLFVAIVTAIRAFQVFDTVAVLTQGGPLNASEVLLHVMYQEGFTFFRSGYSAAIALVFMVGVATLTLLQARFHERRVHYQ